MKSFFGKTILLLGIILILSLPQAALASNDETLVKVEGLSAVYWVKDGVRHPFPLLSIYQSWFGTSFSQVKTLSLPDIATYPLGKNIIFKQGSLIKIQTDPKVYEVTDAAGTITWIKTEADFLSRGLKFSDVRDVPDTFFTDYKISEASSSAPVLGSPTTTVTSTPAAPLPALTLDTSLTVSRDGNYYLASLNVTANRAVTLTVDFAPAGIPTSTVSAAPALLAHLVKMPTPSLSTLYYYEVRALDELGNTLTRSGSFVSYTDVLVVAHPEKIPENAPILLPNVVVGVFSVKNQAAFTIDFDRITPVFLGTPSKFNQVTRTIAVYTWKNEQPDTLVGFTNVAAGTNILNWYNLQRIVTTDTLAAGEQRDYCLVLQNMENISPDADIQNETLDVRLAQITFQSDVSIYLPETTLATMRFRN